MRSLRRRSYQGVNVWPGYVDALSSLLMVVIFVLMIFTVMQLILTDVISGQKSELSSLHRQISALSKALGVEKEVGRELNHQVMTLTSQVDNLQIERDNLSDRNLTLKEQVSRDRDQIEQQLLTIASYQEDIAALRKMRADLEQQVGTLAANLEERDIQLGALRDRSRSLEAMLADQEERTLLAQREVDSGKIRIQALNVLVGQQKEALETQKGLTASARSEITLLNDRIQNLSRQLKEIEAALTVAEQEGEAKAKEIKNLGERLNIELAREVNKLNRYRSDFFGRLQAVLSDVPYVQIEGDRFVFQAELLFDSGSAALRENGEAHLRKLAIALREVAAQIPHDINWILRIDGHTDRVPINTSNFRSNWELSTARALAVVRFLAGEGIPEKRMAAAGFSKFHPLDPQDTAEAYQLNRRIEIKLTSR